MAQVRVQHRLSPDERHQVTAFLRAINELDSSQPNDHLLSDLTNEPRPGFTAAFAMHTDGTMVGYAQASAANDGVLLGCFAHPAHPEVGLPLMRSVFESLPPGTATTWWTDDHHQEMAHALGLANDRRLLNMRCTLPVEATTELPTRPFQAGADETAWLAVNNAAFAWHGEQGGWDMPTLLQRENEAWFDPEGFLLHERDGRLAGFCWTKLFRDDPPVGEIYVIAVHPDFHGRGLGRALTVAGLQHLHAIGATTAMLYVDADNTAAVHLYEQLGFFVHHADQSYRRVTGQAHAD